MEDWDDEVQSSTYTGFGGSSEGDGFVTKDDDSGWGGGQVNGTDSGYSGWGGDTGQDSSTWNGDGGKSRTFNSVTFTARGASRGGRGGFGRKNFGDRGSRGEDSEESSSFGFRRGGFGGRGRGRDWHSGGSRGQDNSEDGDEDQSGGFSSGNDHRGGFRSRGGGFGSRSDGPRRGGFGAPSDQNNDEQNDDDSPADTDGEERGHFGSRGGRRGGFGSRGGRGRDRDQGGFGGGRRRSEDQDEQKDKEGGDSRPREVYIPPPPPEDEQSIFSTINAGINFDRYDEIPVEVTGRDPPKNISSFEECGFLPLTMENIQRCRYTRPTPVQKYAIPIIIQGRDLMACAQTGSGKTAAFLLPAITRLIKEEVQGASRGEQQSPQVLIVSPTRELTLQIYNEARKFTHDSIYKPVVAYGGTSVGHQLRQLEGGCNIIVGTPGRLIDFLNRQKVLLNELKVFILDEADRMLDMGFEPEIRKMVEQFNMPGKGERQTLMFSATFPEQIQQLAAEFLNDYVFLTVGRVGGATTDISQKVVEVGEYEKRDRLSEILQNMGTDRTLVFVETKRNADFLATYLSQAGFPTTSIHGDRFQREREEALRDFRSGRAPVLVATSVAARGLDIPEVKHVINYDLPQTIEEYVHRIGRTGRIGNKGMATAFFQRGKDNALARSMVKVLADAEQDVPDFLEESAQEAIGSNYGPAGGQFASKDIRTGRKGGGGGGFGGGTSNDSGWGEDRGGFGGGFGGSSGGFTEMSATVEEEEEWG